MTSAARRPAAPAGPGLGVPAFVVIALALAACVSGPPPAAPAPAPPPAAAVEAAVPSAPTGDEFTRRRDRYMACLRERGFAPGITPEGDIRFERGGREARIQISTKDPSFLWLGLPRVARAGAGAVEAVSWVNLHAKGAKAYIAKDDYVYVSLETYLPDAERFADLLDRMMAMVEKAMDLFEERTGR